MSDYRVSALPRDYTHANGLTSTLPQWGIYENDHLHAIVESKEQALKVTEGAEEAARQSAREYRQGHDDCVAGRSTPKNPTRSYLDGYSRVGSRLDA